MLHYINLRLGLTFQSENSLSRLTAKYMGNSTLNVLQAWKRK